MTNDHQGFDTLALHAGHTPDETGARAVPIWQTTSYVFKDTEHAARLFALEEPGNIYTRIMNPTTDVLEKRVAALEGGVGGLALSSGMAAITTALLTLCAQGDEIVSTTRLYGGTVTLLKDTLSRMGINTVWVDSDAPEAFAAAITNRTKVVYLETIGNPKLTIPDLEGIARVAHAAGVPVMIDNTTASPALCRPFEHGADIVVHSLTKYLGGHGNSIGGAIVDGGGFDWANGRFPDLVEPDPSYHGLKYVASFGDQAYIMRARVRVLRDMGACISPFNSFLILQGIETLSLRMARHSETALKVARLPGGASPAWHGCSIRGWKAIRATHLPNAISRTARVACSASASRVALAAGRRFIESLKLFSHLANIGDTRSLAIHPASTTHQQLDEEALRAAGVTPDFIRLSIGLETPEDILADLDHALGSVALEGAAPKRT